MDEKRVRRVINKWRRRERKERKVGCSGFRRRFSLLGEPINKNSKTKRRLRMMVGGR